MQPAQRAPQRVACQSCGVLSRCVRVDPLYIARGDGIRKQRERRPLSEDALTLVGEHLVFPNNPLLVSGALWQLSQTRILAPTGNLIRSHARHLAMLAGQSTASQFRSQRSVARTHQSRPNQRGTAVSAGYPCSASKPPAAARTDASVMCGATCYALPDPHRFTAARTPLPDGGEPITSVASGISCMA